MFRFLVLFMLLSHCLLAQNDFKVIAYCVPSADIDSLPYEYLTHLNFSFAIPAPSGDTLLPLKHGEYASRLISKAHKNNVKVFLSIGGWSIGDGGGVDTRFHNLAMTANGRKTFVNSCMKMVEQFGFDGIDLDWEYPDEDHSSATDFVLLSKELYEVLHANNKKLTSAVVSHGKKAYGILEEVYPYMDWINIMAYDGDYGSEELRHHSPFSLALKCVEFWLNERNLPAEKCVLGLPFYAKKGFGTFGFGYKKLLASGASAYDDYWNGHYYNGIITIRAKTLMAKERNLAGVMVWEASLDTHDEFSLFKTIFDAK